MRDARKISARENSQGVQRHVLGSASWSGSTLTARSGADPLLFERSSRSWIPRHQPRGARPQPAGERAGPVDGPQQEPRPKRLSPDLGLDLADAPVIVNVVNRTCIDSSQFGAVAPIAGTEVTTRSR